jgi:hypothetical protein
MQELLENEDNEAVIVTGSPGVGKSLFGIVFLVNVVKAMRDRTTKGRLESITNVLYEQARSTGGSSHYLVNVASAKIVMIPNQTAWQYQTSEQTFVIKDGAWPNVVGLIPSERFHFSTAKEEARGDAYRSAYGRRGAGRLRGQKMLSTKSVLHYSR